MSDIWKKMGQRAFGGSSSSVKRTRSPAGGPAPKKAPAATMPQATNGLSQGHHGVHSPSTRQGPKIPAIFLDPVSDWPTHGQKLEDLTRGEMTAVCRASGMKIQAHSIDAFRVVQRYLTTAKLPFYTFTLKDGSRSLKVVISGLPDIEVEALDDALVDLKFAVADISRLRSFKGATRSWLVTFEPDSERQDLATKKAAEIYSLTSLFHVRVSVAPYRKRPGPPQCYRCQSYGHGSMNCGRPLRCVRCGEAHSRFACPKKKEEKGKCCNCGGDHNASYRGCPAFKKACELEKIARERAIRRQKKTADTRQQPRRETPETDPEEEEAVDDQRGDGADVPDASKRRKRKPRNPANRQERPRKRINKADAPKDQQVNLPRPRDTPRTRIDWPPKPATNPVPDQRPAEDLPAAITTKQKDVAALLADVLKQLTALVGLLTQALPALISSQA